LTNREIADSLLKVCHCCFFLPNEKLFPVPCPLQLKTHHAVWRVGRLGSGFVASESSPENTPARRSTDGSGTDSRRE